MQSRELKQISGKEWVVIIMVAIVVALFFMDSAYKDKEDKTTTEIVAPKPTDDINEQNSWGAELAIRGAIRFQASDPNAIDFVQKTYEFKSDTVWVQKWLISGKNQYGATMKGYGLARVRYNGKGSRRSGDYWDVVEAKIETIR